MADVVIPLEITGDARDVEDAFRRAGRTGDRELDGLGRRAQSTSLSLGKIAGAATAAWAALQGAQAVTRFLSAGVDAASNYEESLSKLTVIAGDLTATEVAEWAERSATGIGATSDEALEMTGTIANLLKTVGIAPDALGGMSTGTVELAADLASFHNVAGGTPEVLDKIRAGLVGEAEPLRTLGVLLSAARVKEEAYASGIAERGAELTEAQKVQARYNIILQDTIDAQGDFARTSDGLANSQRILEAQIGDVRREIGEALIPVVGGAVGALNDLFTSDDEAAASAYRVAVSDLVRDFRELDPTASESELKVQALFGAFEQSEDAQLLVNDLISDLNSLGLTFDDLNRRQQELLADGLVPALDDIAGKVNDLAATSWWEGALDFIAADGPLSKIVAGWLGANESVEEYRRSLLEFEGYIPTLNHVLDHYGQQTETTLGLSIELWGASADTVEGVERRVAASLRATGLYTREEAGNIASAWVRSAQESVRAEEERRGALAESEERTRDFAIEVGRLETVTGDAIPTFDGFGSSVRTAGGDAEDAQDPVGGLADLLGLDDTSSLGGAADWAEARVADLTDTLANLDGKASELDLLKARAELFALAGAALAAEAQARGLDSFLAGQEAFDAAAWTSLRIGEIEYAQQQLAEFTGVFTGGNTESPAARRARQRGGGSGGGSGGGGDTGGGSGGGSGGDDDADTTIREAIAGYDWTPLFGEYIDEYGIDTLRAAQNYARQEFGKYEGTGIASPATRAQLFRRYLMEGGTLEERGEFEGPETPVGVGMQDAFRRYVEGLRPDLERDTIESVVSAAWRQFQQAQRFGDTPDLEALIRAQIEGLDATDPLAALREGRAIAAATEDLLRQQIVITEHATDADRDYWQQLFDLRAADGWTLDEINAQLRDGSSIYSPIVAAIDRESKEADRRTAEAARQQGKLIQQAIRDGGVPLYNALVDAGVIEGNRLAPEVRDVGPTSPVFDFGGGRGVWIGHRFARLDQAGITEVGGDLLAQNTGSAGWQADVLRDIQLAMATLVKEQRRGNTAAEQTAVNTAGGRRSGVLS